MFAVAVIIAALGAVPASSQRSALHFWSVGGGVEADGEDRTLYGATFRYLAYFDEHAPPLTGYWGIDALGGDGQTVIRGTGSLSIFAFPAGQHFSFWLRPVAGVEYRRSEPDDGVGALVGIGGEFIIRPRACVQVAVSVDRLFSTLGTNSQAGLAFRWGRKEKPEQPGT